MPENRIIKVIRELKKAIKEPAVISNADPFKVLISTVLSQRTRDENTKKASEQLFARYNTPQELAKAEIKHVMSLIKPSGFYRVKAKRIINISKELVKRFNATVPHDKEDLLSLPGVGLKTAACVRVYAHNIPDLPVDTHVRRIANRLGLVKTSTPESTEKELKKLVPKRYWIEINNLFVKHGQKTCAPIKPKCLGCVIKKYCEYHANQNEKEQQRGFG